MAGQSQCAHIKFDDDGIRPAPRASPARGLPVGDDRLLDTFPRFNEKTERVAAVADDEEQARRIAQQDLHGTRKQTYSGFLLLWVSFQATGIIYGDIGTSPLYVFSSTFSSQPSWDDLVGALSIIIWSLTLIVTLKYAFVVLRADDDGQGGTFALYSLLSRYVQIVRQDPQATARSSMAPSMERHRTDELEAVGRGLRRWLERSGAAQFALKAIGVMGVSLVMADGVLTPAQSVLGAIQGIKVADPTLQTPTIVGVSCAILVVLFCIQPFGTSKIGTGFAPVVVVWLLFNLSSGIYNLVTHDYTVLKAFSPYFAFAYLIRNGTAGWKSLGGLLLAFTGVEALFADLGAFSRRAIQISWLCLAYPCLVMAYAGQAAYISHDAAGVAFTNPFFYTVPPGSFYFSMVIAVLAAVVASQAMITSTFQLLGQVMRMSYFPHIKVVHTSKHFHEQVYMPLANWLLMIGTVVVTAVYNNTTSLGNAYGVCVILVTFITTCMVTLVALLIWRLPAWLVLPIFLAFAALDGAFLTSVLVKVPEGAWFTLLLAFILSSIFILWRFGKEAQWAAEAADPLTASSLFTLETDDEAEGEAEGDGRPEPPLAGPSQQQEEEEGEDWAVPSPSPSPFVRLQSPLGGTPVSTVPGLGIFFDKTGGHPSTAHLPPSFAHFVRKFAARPSVVVFFHMRALPVPHVPAGERFVVCRVAGPVAPADAPTPPPPPGLQLLRRRRGRGENTTATAASLLLPDAYAVVLRHGYADDVLRPGLARDLVAQLQLFILSSPLSPSSRPVTSTANANAGTDDAGPQRPRSVEEEAASREVGLREDRELEVLRSACSAQTVYVLGKEAMRVRRNGPLARDDAGDMQGGGGHGRKAGGGGRVWNFFRRGLLEVFLWIRENSRTKLADLDIDVDKLVEVGFVKEI